MKVLFRNVRSGKRQAAIADLESIARKNLDAALELVKEALVESHRRVVADWEHQPDFAARKYVEADRLAVSVYPTGPSKSIWEYVDQGTRPHPITPKRARFLRFQWGGPGSYVAKTLPRPARTVSGGGRVVGGVTVYAKRVEHPGSEGRGFTQQIAEDIEPDFLRVVENAFRATAREVSE